MGKIASFKRIITEDFESKDQNLISKLAFSINAFADDVANLVNKNLSFDDNLNITTKTITIAVNALGIPTSTTQLKTGLLRGTTGSQVIKVVNKTLGSNAAPTATPFITYTENSGVITITNITNLTANIQFAITIILYS